MKKRDFLRSLGLMAVVPGDLSPLERLLAETRNDDPHSQQSDEDFWLEVRKGYRLKPDYINLENGYYCMLPESTLETYLELIREVNYHASWYMRTEQWDNKDKSAKALAEVAGCSPEELVITRNTTESLDLVIAGQNWEQGDEAVMALQDYGAMLNQFGLMEKKHGIKTVKVSIPNHPKDDDEIVTLYEQALTDRTKLLMICHMVNITGQVLPVRKICDMAHKRGVKVMVDGAHAFAHLEFRLDELNCDYYGTSLHKWLSVPLGAGFLYARKEHISSTWPLMAEHPSHDESIKKLNHIGTHPVHTDLAILTAIDYHNNLGIKRKEARLKYLQDYWTSKVRGIDRVIVNTPSDMDRHGAIGNVGIDGLAPKEFAKKLLNDFKIWTVAINRPGVRGLRITPNVYTTTGELDALIESISKIAKA